MTKYVLIFNGGGMPDTEEEQAAVMAAWGAWCETMGQAVADPGYPFVSMAMNVDSDGTVGEGPAGTLASGYTIISADSFESACEMAKGCPILSSGGQISVYETIEMGP